MLPGDEQELRPLSAREARDRLRELERDCGFSVHSLRGLTSEQVQSISNFLGEIDHLGREVARDDKLARIRRLIITAATSPFDSDLRAAAWPTFAKLMKSNSFQSKLVDEAFVLAQQRRPFDHILWILPRTEPMTKHFWNTHASALHQPANHPARNASVVLAWASLPDVSFPPIDLLQQSLQNYVAHVAELLEEEEGACVDLALAATATVHRLTEEDVDNLARILCALVAHHGVSAAPRRSRSAAHSDAVDHSGGVGRRRQSTVRYDGPPLPSMRRRNISTDSAAAHSTDTNGTLEAHPGPRAGASSSSSSSPTPAKSPSRLARFAHARQSLPHGGIASPMHTSPAEDAAVELAAAMHARFGASALAAVKKMRCQAATALFTTLQRNIWVRFDPGLQLPPYLDTVWLPKHPLLEKSDSRTYVARIVSQARERMDSYVKHHPANGETQIDASELDADMQHISLCITKLRALTRRYENSKLILERWRGVTADESTGPADPPRCTARPQWQSRAQELAVIAADFTKIQQEAEAVWARGFQLAKEHDSIFTPNKSDLIRSRFPRGSFVKRPMYLQELEAPEEVRQARDFFATAVTARNRFQQEWRSFDRSFNSITSNQIMVSSLKLLRKRLMDVRKAHQQRKRQRQQDRASQGGGRRGGGGFSLGKLGGSGGLASLLADKLKDVATEPRAPTQHASVFGEDELTGLTVDALGERLSRLKVELQSYAVQERPRAQSRVHSKERLATPRAPSPAQGKPAPSQPGKKDEEKEPKKEKKNEDKLEQELITKYSKAIKLINGVIGESD